MQNLPPQIVETNIPPIFEEFQAFVYKFTNLTNNMIYIGYHKGKPFDGYYHSSTNKDFQNGFMNPEAKFRYEVLHYGNVNYCKSVEHKLLKQVDAANHTMYYNKTNGSPIINIIDPELMQDIATEITSDRSYSGVEAIRKELDRLPEYKLQIRNITVLDEHVTKIKNVINTKNSLNHLLVVVLLDRVYRGRKGDMIIDGNHSIQGAKKSKHGRNGLIPVLEIPYDLHKDWSDDEIDLLAALLNPRNENPRLETNIETIAQLVSNLLNQGYDIGSKEIATIKQKFNVDAAEGRKINALAKQMFEEQNPSDTTWIDYGRGTDDGNLLKDKVAKENKKTGVLCRTFSSEKFGITESVEKMYEYIHDGINIDTYRILFHFKDSGSQNTWFNSKEKMYKDTLTWLFKPHNISVEFEYLPTERTKFTDKKIVKLDN